MDSNKLTIAAQRLFNNQLVEKKSTRSESILNISSLKKGKISWRVYIDITWIVFLFPLSYITWIQIQTFVRSFIFRCLSWSGSCIQTMTHVIITYWQISPGSYKVNGLVSFWFFMGQICALIQSDTSTFSHNTSVLLLQVEDSKKINNLAL